MPASLACQVTDAVLSPGSRSGPLALALAAADEQGLIRLHVRVDEREAGFLALGLAKASRRLVPVVTTSGTAVANLHPAMLEAQHADVPVLAVTADRPARLRGTGANQTTDQREIFPGVPLHRAGQTQIVTAAAAHLNLELDEPLVEPIDWDFPSHRLDPVTPEQEPQPGRASSTRPAHRRRRRRRRQAARPRAGPRRRLAAARRAELGLAQRRGPHRVPDAAAATRRSPSRSSGS